MKTGLYLRTNYNGSSLFVSPGKLTVRNVDMSTSSEVTINFSSVSGDVTANAINYIVVKAVVGGAIDGTTIEFTSTEPTLAADGYWYEPSTDNRVIGAFWGGDVSDNRFPVFYQDGQSFYYSENPNSASGGDVTGSGYFKTGWMPGTGTSAVLPVDFDGFVPNFVDAIDFLFSIRADVFKTTAGAVLSSGPSTGSVLRVLLVENDSDLPNIKSQGTSGSIRILTKDQVVDVKLSSNSNFDSADSFSVWADFNGWALPPGLAESQI